MDFDSVKVITKNHKEVTLRMIKSDEAQTLLDTMVEIAEASPYILTKHRNFSKTPL